MISHPLGGATVKRALLLAIASSVVIASAPVQSQIYTEAESLKYIQTQLYKLGYDPGPVDEVAGPATRAAVERYMRASGLSLDPFDTDGFARKLKADVDALAKSPYAGNDPPNGSAPDKPRITHNIGRPLVVLGGLVLAVSFGAWKLVRALWRKWF